MKAFHICGYSASGKTTVAENVIQRLSENGTQVASLKDIHFEGFQIDTDGKNTHRHRVAGADPVVARGGHETDFLFSRQMALPEIARHIDAGWLVVEGYASFSLPQIVCGKTLEEVDDFLDETTFAIAGVVANEHKSHRGIRVYNVLDAEDLSALMRAIHDKVFPMLPYVDAKCCRLCGLDCERFVPAVIQGRKRPEDCLIGNGNIMLKIDGRKVKMVPFVEKLLRNAVLGVVSELEGYRSHAEVEVSLNGAYNGHQEASGQ